MGYSAAVAQSRALRRASPCFTDTWRPDIGVRVQVSAWGGGVGREQQSLGQSACHSDTAAPPSRAFPMCARVCASSRPMPVGALGAGHLASQR